MVKNFKTKELPLKKLLKVVPHELTPALYSGETIFYPHVALAKSSNPSPYWEVHAKLEGKDYCLNRCPELRRTFNELSSTTLIKVSTLSTESIDDLITAFLIYQIKEAKYFGDKYQIRYIFRYMQDNNIKQPRLRAAEIARELGCHKSFFSRRIDV